MVNKKTLVLGASPKPDRYSNRAVHSLNNKGIETVALGNRTGNIEEQEILTGQPDLEDIHTITLYLNPKRQKQYYDYILGLEPKRIIFNPGTENIELAQMAKAKGIETEFACTLVMLSIDDY